MAAGYVHYEVSNFAREGFESRHNLAYWTGRSYVGLGNGAHSYHHPRRSWNLRDWPVYADAVRRGTSPVADTEVLDREAQRMERIWLGLRIRAGLPEQALTPEGREACRSWVARGLAERAGDRVRLTTAGWLVLDRLAVELDGIESREDATSPATAGPPSEPVSRADRD